MQVRMPTVTITEEDRRAIRFTNDRRKTQCTRIEAQAFIQDAIDRALADLRYRWNGATTPEAVANGADPARYEASTAPAAATAAQSASQAPAPQAAPQPVGASA